MVAWIIRWRHDGMFDGRVCSGHLRGSACDEFVMEHLANGAACSVTEST